MLVSEIKKINEKGVSLLLAVIIMAILLAIVLGLGAILLSQSRQIREMGDSVVAIFAADTGIEQTLYILQPSFSGNIGQARYNATSTCSSSYFDSGNCPAGFDKDPNCSASYICIKSVGEYKNVRRAIEASR